MAKVKYAIIIKMEEDKSYTIKYPDFPGLVSITDRYANVKKIATNMLNIHIHEILDKGEKLLMPIRPFDITRALESGEFIDTIDIELDDNIKEQMEKETTIKQQVEEETSIENFKSSSDETQKEKIEEINIGKEESVNSQGKGYLRIVIGLIFIVSILLPIAKISLYGTKSEYISFWNTGLLLQGFGRGLYKIKSILLFIDLILIFSGLFSIYSGISKSKFYSKAANVISILLFILILIGFKMSVRQYAGPFYDYVGMSFLFILLLLGVILAIIDFIFMIKRGAKV